MFPSTGHFKSLHCPFHLEDNCGRIYCHFRHVKNVDEKSGENTMLSKLENQICSDLKIDKETFDLVVNEEDETVHEKLLNKRLKTMFSDCDTLIDNFRFPETLSKDSFEFTTINSSTEKNVHDIINLTDDDTPLDEGPLKQFLEEDAKQNQSSEHKNRNTLEKRHIIISCLEKIDKREFHPRRIGVIQARKFSSISAKTSSLNEAENTDDICTQPLNNKDLADMSQKVKQEDDASESSGSEDNAEVDKILTQMELLNPQLFNSEKGLKREPIDVEDEDTKLNLASQDSLQNDLDLSSQNTVLFPSSDCPVIPPTVPKDNRVGRINLKSIQAINNEVTTPSIRVKNERPYEPMFATPAPPAADPIIIAATIAEQNRLKNVFKNTICSNIDQFFDLSDACKVYGTEIFNLLEPLLNYLIEKLNPEFNFEKLRQLHSQNISLACGLPFVSSCDHPKNCIECHNLLLSAVSRCNVRKSDKTTETSSSLARTNNDTPLRKIEAGLHDITKEMLSLGIPVEDEVPVSDKLVSQAPDIKKCQTESSSRHESSREHRASDRKRSRDSDKSRSKSESKSSRDKKDRHDDRKHSSSRKHSRSEHRSSRSSSHKHEKRRKESDSDDSNEDETEKSTSKSEHRPAKSSSHKHDKRKKESDSDESDGDETEKSSASGRRSLKSASQKSSDKRRKESDSDESSDNEHEKGSSKKHRSSGNREHERKKRSSTDKGGSESKKQKVDVTKAKNPENVKRRSGKSESHSEKNDSDDSGRDNEDNLFGDQLSDGYSDFETDDNQFDGEEKDNAGSTDASSSENEDEEERNAKNAEDFVDKYPQAGNKKRVSHVAEGRSSVIYRKPIIPKKKIPTPAEALYQRMQNKKPEEALSDSNPMSNWLGNSNEKVRISHVPNVALLLKAKERLKNDLLHKTPAPTARITVPQTNTKGHSRIAHVPLEQPEPKDVPVHASTVRPVINTFKTSHNIPGPTRQNGLDRLYNAFVKKVPPELAGELALKEEKQIHEKVTITKVYLNSLAMALHRIAKEDPAKLVEKQNEFPVELNGISIYDIASRHVLTYEQLEINGFPLPVPSRPGCCGISTKAIHYKPLTSKRSGDRFYCQQCKELFDISPETGMPITPTPGCRFHLFRPRKEPGRTRHDMYYPCCNKGISESGCVSADHHTPDTTDDDCLEGFLETREAPPGERGSKRIYSLDCEMCYTTVGSELTRVTVIGHDCNTVYDSLVKPRNPVLDYCTKFSGITEEKLRRVTKTLEQVRQEMFRFIFKDTILIGHSLENDLKALKILHYKIVDTSVMYPHRDAPERKFSLKFLASNLVHFLIQESEYGHDSKEDALACMKLVWKKLKEDAQVHRPRKIIGSPKRSS